MSELQIEHFTHLAEKWCFLDGKKKWKSKFEGR